MNFSKLDLDNPGTTEMLKIELRYYESGTRTLVGEGCIFRLQNVGN